MYSQVGGSLGTKTKLGPWASRHSCASVKRVIEKFLTQCPLMVLVLVLVLVLLMLLSPLLVMKLPKSLWSTDLVVVVAVHASVCHFHHVHHVGGLSGHLYNHGTIS